ncbi:MAG: CPBP family intramembrane metalloprotease [Bacteroidales bacterium]|nr:CPBP family intramembrane metalloprotease [Bacteroidales bacterium]
MNKQTKNIIRFSLLAFAPMIIMGLAGTRIDYHSPLGTGLAAICMLFPLIVTIILQLIAHEKPLRNIGISWKVNRWWFIGWLLMPVIALIVTGVSALMPGAELTTNTELIQAQVYAMNEMAQGQGGIAITPMLLIGITLLSALFAGATINALFAFGEESGWRGYLLRQFKGQHFTKSALIIGAIWGVWHSPLILLGHNYPEHPVTGVFVMVLFCMAFAPLIQYFRVKSGSVIVAAIMHGTFNAVAGLSIMLIDNFNDLLCGSTGAAGIITIVLIDLGLYCFDKYVTKEQIFTSQL